MPIEQRCRTWPECAVQHLVDKHTLVDTEIELRKKDRRINPLRMRIIQVLRLQQEAIVAEIDHDACAECPNRTLEAE